MNRIRLARRSFEREVWEDRCWRHRTYYGPKVWSAAWRLFERNRESVEADREYFLQVRPQAEEEIRIPRLVRRAIGMLRKRSAIVGWV